MGFAVVDQFIGDDILHKIMIETTIITSRKCFSNSHIHTALMNSLSTVKIMISLQQIVGNTASFLHERCLKWGLGYT